MVDKPIRLHLMKDCIFSFKSNHTLVYDRHKDVLPTDYSMVSAASGASSHGHDIAQAKQTTHLLFIVGIF